MLDRNNMPQVSFEHVTAAMLVTTASAVIRQEGLLNEELCRDQVLASDVAHWRCSLIT